MNTTNNNVINVPSTHYGAIALKTNPDGLVSLTDLWKASGSRISRRPGPWLDNDGTQDFLTALAEKLRSQKSDLIKIVQGRGKPQGTYAHWQIALAYAKYLSPALHMAVNEIFKGFIEADAGIAQSILERTKDQKAVEAIANKAIDKTEDEEALYRMELRARAKAANRNLNRAIADRGGFAQTCAREQGRTKTVLYHYPSCQQHTCTLDAAKGIVMTLSPCREESMTL